MLHVKTPDEVLNLIHTAFTPLPLDTETRPLAQALGRVLAKAITADAFVPDFDRSTVDGYALRAADTFGCTEAIPAILPVVGEVRMGERPVFALETGTCCAIPTGGALPQGADCAVMVEYTEDYGDGTIGVFKPAAPGLNLIRRGDDAAPGKLVLAKGRRLSAEDLGALAALGITSVPVTRRLRVAVLSTGDELVPPEVQPGPGQIRDVNAPLLSALLLGFGAEPVFFGIVADEESLLRRRVEESLLSCDAVLLSGGSSVGAKDAAARIISTLGELLLHGIAIKPGKPTLLGRVDKRPLVGLPGHPQAAALITRLFVLPLLARLSGRDWRPASVTAELSENVPANHGRAQATGCRLLWDTAGGLKAQPIHAQSGLITGLAGADGYFLIERDCEGLAKGAQVQVFLCLGD